jgi:hypothetical protein
VPLFVKLYLFGAIAMCIYQFATAKESMRFAVGISATISEQLPTVGKSRIAFAVAMMFVAMILGVSLVWPAALMLSATRRGFFGGGDE